MFLLLFHLQLGSLQSISVTNPPTKTTYVPGENFDPSGCVVTAIYEYETIDVTSACSFSCHIPLRYGDSSVIVTYESQSTTISIVVNPLPVPAPSSTIMLCHFDNSQVDEVSGNSFDSAQPSYVTGKFSTALNTGFNNSPVINKDATYMMTNALTFEFWKKVGSTTYFSDLISRRRDSSGSGKLFSLDRFSTITTSGIKMNTTTGAGEYPFASSCVVDNIPSSFDFSIFHHFAVVVDSGTYKVFVDGILSCHGNLNSSYCEIYNFLSSVGGYPLDEFLVCTTAKYSANFTPNSGPYYLDS